MICGSLDCLELWDEGAVAPMCVKDVLGLPFLGNLWVIGVTFRTTCLVLDLRPIVSSGCRGGNAVIVSHSLKGVIPSQWDTSIADETCPRRFQYQTQLDNLCQAAGLHPGNRKSWNRESWRVIAFSKWTLMGSKSWLGTSGPPV